MRREPTVRLAAAADAPAVALLAAELGYPTNRVQVEERLAAIAATTSQVVLVAELDGLVVGWLEVVEMLRVESGRFGEITGLVVTSAHRGAGVGGVLVEAAWAWCAARGLAELRVRSNVVRSDAHRFYRRLGFAVTKTQVVLRRTDPA